MKRVCVFPTLLIILTMVKFDVVDVVKSTSNH